MTRSPKDQSRPPPNHRKELLRLFNGLAHRHSAWQVFADFNEAAAIAISNAVDFAQRGTRETRYMELIRRYKPHELAKFPEMLGELTLALEDETGDALGAAFHELELHNKWAGQFFTPYPLCHMVAKLTLGDQSSIETKIAERGFVTAAEPAVGSGAMVIALAEEMKRAGINYQHHLHATAVDIDIKCVHMAYVQFSLLHIPAVVIHGNSLSLEEYSRWYTPAHVMGGWTYRLRRRVRGGLSVTDVASVTKRAGEETQHAEPAQLTLF